MSSQTKVAEKPTLVVQLNNTWTAFPDDVHQALYQAYKKGTKVVELVVQSERSVPSMRFYSKYYVDFNDMKQYNAHTKKTREVKLLDEPGAKVPQLNGKLVKLTKVKFIPNKEKYVLEKSTEEKKNSDDCALILTRMCNEWLKYSSDIHDALQEAYCAGHTMVEFAVMSCPGYDHMQYYSRYVVDFSTMVQYNVHTNKTRRIRIVSKKNADKDIRVPILSECTHEDAPGKLAKGAHAIKTLGAEVPKQLATEDVVSMISNSEAALCKSEAVSPGSVLSVVVASVASVHSEVASRPSVAAEPETVEPKTREVNSAPKRRRKLCCA